MIDKELGWNYLERIKSYLGKEKKTKTFEAPVTVKMLRTKWLV